MNDNEKRLLTHGPKHKILDNLDEKEFELAVEKSHVKIWYNYNKIEETEDDEDDKDKNAIDMNDTTTDEENEKIEMIEAEAGEVYNPITKMVDLTKLKATKIKGNKKVILPKSLKPMREADLHMRKNKYLAEFKKYRDENTNNGN